MLFFYEKEFSVTRLGAADDIELALNVLECPSPSAYM